MMNQNQTIKEFELIGPSDFASQHNKKKRLRFESDTANHTAISELQCCERTTWLPCLCSISIFFLVDCKLAAHFLSNIQ